MMAFVQEYLDGKRSRLDFDLDFNHYLIKHYAKMERENPDLAECFNFYLAEDGFDLTEGLTDDQHRRLIQKPCVMDFSSGNNYSHSLHPLPGAFFIC